MSNRCIYKLDREGVFGVSHVNQLLLPNLQKKQKKNIYVFFLFFTNKMIEIIILPP